MENLYLLLITNRASNIIEDLETLRLLSKVVPDVAGTANNLTEEKISDKCFDLIFAFDEVITAGGYREPITLQQIRTNMDMESHEEKVHLMIKHSKMESAKDQARDAAKSIRERQKEQQRLGLGTGMTGIGGGSSNSDASPAVADVHLEVRTDVSVPSPRISGSTTTSTKTAAVKGMSLASKGGKTKSYEDALVKEDKLAPIISSAKALLSESSGPPVLPVLQQPIMLVISERISAKMTRDGMVDMFEVKGSLTLTANSEDVAACAVQLQLSNDNDFVFVTHPKVNKALYDTKQLLQLKDSEKGFPCARPVGILRWSYASNTDDLVPLKINCWPDEVSRGMMNVSIEYTLEKALELHDVRIKIPLGTTESPGIVSVDGAYRVNSQTNELLWEMQLIDQSNSTGSLEFNIPQKNADAFFPIVVQFSSQKLFCDVNVLNVFNIEGVGPIQYALSKTMSTDEYIIE